MHNFFAELQMQTVTENNTVAEMRLKLNKLAAYFKNQPDYEQELLYFSNFRSGILPKTLREADAFFCTGLLPDCQHSGTFAPTIARV